MLISKPFKTKGVHRVGRRRPEGEISRRRGFLREDGEHQEALQQRGVLRLPPHRPPGRDAADAGAGRRGEVRPVRAQHLRRPAPTGKGGAGARG